MDVTGNEEGLKNGRKERVFEFKHKDGRGLGIYVRESKDGVGFAEGEGGTSPGNIGDEADR